MRLFFQRVMVLLSAGLLTFCSSSNIRVSYDYDREAPFDSYRTFTVLEPSEEMLSQMKLRNPRVLRYIHEAIEDEMIKRGYKQVMEGADLEIAYFVTSTVQTVGQEVGGVNVGMGWGGYYGGVGVSSRVGGRIEYTDYVDGSLLLEMYDPASKGLLFHGAARGTFRADTSDPLKVSQDAVRQIMYRYKWKVKAGR